MEPRTADPSLGAVDHRCRWSAASASRIVDGLQADVGAVSRRRSTPRSKASRSAASRSCSRPGIPGIVSQAVFLTFGTLGALLVAYRVGRDPGHRELQARHLRRHRRHRAALPHQLRPRLLRLSVPLIHSSGTFGIVFSVFVVVIAALNLVLDFDFIETGRGARARRSTWSGTAPSGCW